MIKPIIIHYPSGGFGNYINVLISMCFDAIDTPEKDFKFSVDGNSHDFPKSTWCHYEDNIRLFRDDILLVDSGIERDYIEPIIEKFPNSPIIRMCIDEKSKSIVTQTCRYKAERSQFVIDGEWWEQREQYTLMYHYGKENNDYYINNFKPLDGCTNINISDLFVNFDKVLEQLSTVVGSYDKDKAYEIHNGFLESNNRYYKAEELVNIVQDALETKNHVELDDYSLHDQGYLLFWLERKYNIKEIPPYDYREWFKNTKEIETCLKLIR